jgi:rod shape-determining protein MreB
MALFDFVYDKFSKDIGIDLGTANTLVYVKGKGIAINEPSVVAINQKTKQILAIGDEAKRMVGRTPAHIVAHRPLTDGVISDFDITEQMLRYFIEKVSQATFGFLSRPRVVIGIPSGVTEVEKRAVQDATLNAGARAAFLIEEPMAAAIGARLPVQDPQGCFIVDIGGGTSESAVISLGGIVVSKSIRVAGDELNENIVQFARDEFNLLIGDRTAEDVKIRIGSAYGLKEKNKMPIRGRDLLTGLPKEVIVTDDQIRQAMARSVRLIVNNIKMAVEESPPELVADIMERGITIAGGGALLRGLDKLLAEETQMPITIADDPLTAVVRGTGVILEDIESLKDVLVPTQLEPMPR